ncbi:MAG: YCF48-related protein [Lysobacterales bacterium]
MIRSLLAATLLGIAGFCGANAEAAERPRWHAQASPTAAQLRDVSVVDARFAWAAGDDGVVLRTSDGGRNWRAINVADAAADGVAFRDIEAFSARSAVVLAIGHGAASRIYRTDDAGKSWQRQYQGRELQPALACAGFWNASQGVALGEAREGRFQLRVTTDGGNNWQRVVESGRPEARMGERVIGNGQNCVATTGNGRIAFAVSDGARARLVTSDDLGRSWRSLELPHLAVVAPGAIGLLLKGGNNGYAARGVSDADVSRHMARLSDKTANDRTALRRDGRVKWISVGTDGSTLSDRDLERSATFAQDGFAAVDGTANGALVLAVGSDGRIAQLRW